nr:hypothetical protein Iba_chr01eCG6710 [Ipomoea batatas]
MPPLSALRTPSTFTATSFSFVISGAMFDHPSVQMCCRNVELRLGSRCTDNKCTYPAPQLHSYNSNNDTLTVA